MNITITKKNEIKEILSIGQKEIQDFSFTEEDLNSYLDNENHILLSAVEDKVLKGFISARISGNEAEIDAVPSPTPVTFNFWTPSCWEDSLTDDITPSLLLYPHPISSPE